ncbi:hypothetical protein OHS18_13600 [Amycolatopsis sp. NBC_00355]|uniref:hypothetical protein n=1 Tax=Amycolatopsis sp. NBC_00355 TaxID=2975957 RepID=UPI002E256247
MPDNTDWIAQHAARRTAAQISTDQPRAVAAYLRTLLSRCTEYATTPTGGPMTEVVPVEQIRHALLYLTSL